LHKRYVFVRRIFCCGWFWPWK